MFVTANVQTIFILLLHTNVATPKRRHTSFIYSIPSFISQLSFLCLVTNPHTDPENGRLTVTAYSVLRFSSQQGPLSPVSDSPN